MSRQNTIQIIAYIVAAVSVLLIAYRLADWVVVPIVALIVALLFAASPWLQTWWRGASKASPPLSPIPPHLNARFAALVVAANTQLTDAKEKLKSSLEALKKAQTEANAQDATDESKAAVPQAVQKVTEGEEAVAFEESQLARLLSSGQRINWATVLQYVVFASLAAYVLWYLMKGITTSPPPGTTPRSMITLLISVVTVGIALILALSTIVSERLDEKRFSQGKEVLTVLLGVLGTIVGFYFGTTQDQASGVAFAPLVVQTAAGGQPTSLSTSIRGGRAPFSYEVTFTPTTITAVKGTSPDGNIVVPIDPKSKPEFIVITAADSAGNTGSIEYKPTIPPPK